MKSILDELTSTARVKPNEHSRLASPNRIRSLGYAIAGCLYMLRRQKNIRIQALASAAVLLLALWLGMSALEWAVLILTITMVWVAEFINAAIEAAVNLATLEVHPMAKVAKDVAAAAVLLAVLASVLIGSLILGPPLLDKWRSPALGM